MAVGVELPASAQPILLDYILDKTNGLRFLDSLNTSCYTYDGKGVGF